MEHKAPMGRNFAEYILFLSLEELYFLWGNNCFEGKQHFLEGGLEWKCIFCVILVLSEKQPWGYTLKGDGASLQKKHTT